MSTKSVSRRSFLAASGTASLALALPRVPVVPAKKIPVGLELYSVRGELEKDLMKTVTAVGKMGYEVVEFYSPYFKWTPAYAKEVRALMDSLGIRCNSTHNDSESFTTEGMKKAVELNQIIGSKYIIWASADPARLGGWSGIAERLTKASEKLVPLGMGTGYHNHGVEFRVISGQRPIDALAANTPKEVVMQLDVGHCVESGADPAAFIHANPGRVRSLHCKEWSSGKRSRIEKTEKTTLTPTGPETSAGGNLSFGSGGDSEKGFRVLIGEGDVAWKRVIDAAESVGGVEYYLVEQEGSRFPELETAERSLQNWKKVHAQF